jgi:hypothetical protein
MTSFKEMWIAEKYCQVSKRIRVSLDDVAAGDDFATKFEYYIQTA